MRSGKSFTTPFYSPPPRRLSDFLKGEFSASNISFLIIFKMINNIDIL
jgi:hypothetical protein